MAVNVVIALYYYLQWTAALFRGPEEPEAAAPAGTAGTAPALRVTAPASLTAAIALTAAVGIVLSGAPQLVLRFAAVNLF